MLRKTFWKTSITEGELTTVTYKSESYINSISIMYASKYNEDIIPISPKMFKRILKGVQETVTRLMYFE